MLCFLSQVLRNFLTNSQGWFTIWLTLLRVVTVGARQKCHPNVPVKRTVPLFLQLTTRFVQELDYPRPIPLLLLTA